MDKRRPMNNAQKRIWGDEEFGASTAHHEYCKKCNGCKWAWSFKLGDRLITNDYERGLCRVYDGTKERGRKPKEIVDGASCPYFKKAEEEK